MSVKTIQGAKTKSYLSRLKKDMFSVNGALYLMILVPMAILIIFHYVPMWGVQIAFKDFRASLGITESPWVGLKHFKKFFSYYRFGDVMRNTLMINLYDLATFPLSLVLAILFNYIGAQKYKRFVQTVSYAPHFISTVVMCSMLLQFFSARGGLINAFLGVFGVPAVNYMAKPQYFYTIYIWSGVWQGIGYSSIIYIAALAGISPELHEAAIVDGANIWQRIWHIDIPGVLPTFCILLIMRCGSLLSVGYEKVLLLQNNLNSTVSEVISTYSYKVGLASSSPQYSYSSAIGLFTSLINMIMLIIVNKISDRLSGSSLF